MLWSVYKCNFVNSLSPLPPSLPSFLSFSSHSVRAHTFMRYPSGVHAYTCRENVHHDRNSQGDYLATDLIGSLQPTSGRGMPTGLIYWNPRRLCVCVCVTRREVIFARVARNEERHESVYTHRIHGHEYSDGPTSVADHFERKSSRTCSKRRKWLEYRESV